MPRPTLETLLADVAAAKISPVYLVSGDLVVAEPAAQRLAEALAERTGVDVASHRRPASLEPILADLRTYSLFAPAKVLLAVDTAILADPRAAAELVDQAAEVLPIEAAGGELRTAERQAASRLLQVLRLFDIDPESGKAEDAVAALPDEALRGGRAKRKKGSRGRTKKAVATLRDGLTALLEAARAAGMKGYAEGDLAELGAILRHGLPEGHVLVLAESSVAREHPVAKALAAAGASIDLGSVGVGRGGEWLGLEALVAQLEHETGTAIARDAVDELAQRTLRQTGDFRNRQVGTDSTARFAAEYRKLAAMAAGGRISRKLVAEGVEDRGEEDVWQILDAVGQGRGGEALARFRRFVGGADDALAARLSFFALLAGFCRQLAAVAGMMKLHQVPRGVRNYRQFQDRWVPVLQQALTEGKNPLAGLHAFRLFRAYQAASRIRGIDPACLPGWVLETELRLKGDSNEADVAIAELMVRVAAAAGGR